MNPPPQKKRLFGMCRGLAVHIRRITQLLSQKNTKNRHSQRLTEGIGHVASNIKLPSTRWCGFKPGHLFPPKVMLAIDIRSPPSYPAQIKTYHVSLLSPSSAPNPMNPKVHIIPRFTTTLHLALRLYSFWKGIRPASISL